MTFDELVVLMKERKVTVKKKELELVRDVFATYQLHGRAIALAVRYPRLGFRSFKAAGYVFHKEVWVNEFLAGSHNEGIFAEVRRSDNDAGHFVGVTPAGVYFCDCKDFLYNLRAFQVFAGPAQQPCCHILAVALNDLAILKYFLSPEEVYV